MATKTKMTVYNGKGDVLAEYADVQILTTMSARSLCFKYNEKRGDNVVTRTITTTLPYFSEEEFEHSGKFTL